MLFVWLVVVFLTLSHVQDVMTLNETAFFRDVVDRDTDDFFHGRLSYVCVGDVEIQALPVHYISLLMVKYSDWFPQEWYRNLCEVLMRKIGTSEPQQQAQSTMTQLSNSQSQ
jgi:hypothetical protein